VFSHPQALAQCERFLRTLPGAEIVASYDTAGSARIIRDEGLRDTAAVASRRAAEFFGLVILCEGIQDFDHNITRFIIVARNAQPLAAADKTTLAFALKNEPGACSRRSASSRCGTSISRSWNRGRSGRPWDTVLRGSCGGARRSALRPRSSISRSSRAG
jgi:hypothetical protein